MAGQFDEDWGRSRQFVQRMPDGTFRVIPETVEFLSGIDCTVVSISVVGPSRSGKSTLMNFLAGARNGFTSSFETSTPTEGIWIWCHPHPTKPRQVLLLLDTEGINDVTMHSTSGNDKMLWSLAVLLSSTFILNISALMNADSLKKLSLVTELIEGFKPRMVDSDEELQEYRWEDFTEFFPIIILAIRDFIWSEFPDFKKLKQGEKYLTSLLQPILDDEEYNRPRDAIRRTFKSHHGFLLPLPVKGEVKRLATTDQQRARPPQFDHDFQTKVAEFTDFVYNKTEIKKFQRGQPATIQLFIQIAEEIVTAINMGFVPSLETTVEIATYRENERLLCESKDIYDREIRIQLYGSQPSKTQRTDITLPTTELELLRAHQIASDVAMRFLNRSAIFDKLGTCTVNFMTHLHRSFGSILNQNRLASTEACNSALHEMYQVLLATKSYRRPGGYRDYKNDLNELSEEYKKTKPGKGVMDKLALAEFLKSKTTDEVDVIMADSDLLETSKIIAEVKKERETAVADGNNYHPYDLLIIEALKESQAVQLRSLRKKLERMYKQREEEMEVLVEKNEAEVERMLRASAQFLHKALHIEEINVQMNILKEKEKRSLATVIKKASKDAWNSFKYSFMGYHLLGS